jgi:ATP-dependent RNA circularization protein (DNA/RNA ligase family)
MEEYHKIHTVFKRDVKGKIIETEYAHPEIFYLLNNTWSVTEKIDGTNIRIGFKDEKIEIGGRTNNAQIPVTLVAKLQELFTVDKLQSIFNYPDQVILFGEGYGSKIQKGGSNYIPDGVNFILFDVKVGEWWLKKEDVFNIAQRLQIDMVPFLGEWTLLETINKVRNKELKSAWNKVPIEGVVCRPLVQLFNRKGERIITKLKVKDFDYK